MTEVFFHGFGVATSLGLTVAETRDALFRAAPPRPSEPWRLLGGGVTLAAVLPEALVTLELWCASARGRCYRRG